LVISKNASPQTNKLLAFERRPLMRYPPFLVPVILLSGR
jgi:hypothetical protein